MDTLIRIGAFISGGGSNLQAIIDACESGSIPGTLVFVGTDNPGAAGLKRAIRHGIPTFQVDYRRIIRDYDQTGTFEAPPDFDLAALTEKQGFFKADAEPQWIRRFLTTRATAEYRLLEHMRAFPFDLLVLAGFMRNLTPYFIDRVNTDPQAPRIMNIHPALLPAFPGVDGYGDTFRYGCKVGGCTVHFIDYGEDSGPIIAQACFPIQPDDTLETVRQRGLALEWQLYPECIRKFAKGGLTIERQVFTQSGGRVVSRAVVRERPLAEACDGL